MTGHKIFSMAFAAVYPAYVQDAEKWIDASLRPEVLRASDVSSVGMAAEGCNGFDVCLQAGTTGRVQSGEAKCHRPHQNGFTTTKITIAINASTGVSLNTRKNTCDF